MDLLGLGWRRDLASADGPDWLVGDDDVLPLSWLEQSSQGLELGLDDLVNAAGLTLLEGLADAEDDLHPELQSLRGLASRVGVGLAHLSAALRVADDDALDAGVQEQLSGDLAGPGAWGLEVAVLGSNVDVAAFQELAQSDQLQGSRGDEDLDAVVRDSLQNGSVLLDEVAGAIALEVSADDGNSGRHDWSGN